MKYQFEYSLTEEEIKKQNRVLFEESKLVKILKFAPTMLGILTSTIIMLYFWFTHRLDFSTLRPYFIILVFIILLTITFFLSRNWLKPIFDANAKIFANKNQTTQFDEDFITDTMLYSKKNKKVKVHYINIKKLIISDTAIYFIIQKKGGMVLGLPLSVFTSDEEKEEFLKFINSKINTPKINK